VLLLGVLLCTVANFAGQRCPPVQAFVAVAEERSTK
jgi:hypothetical protein